MIFHGMRDDPLYLRLKDAILRDIRSGRFKPGDRLPTEDEFMRLHKISRITVRKALDLLQQEQLIERFPRRGTIVAPSLLQQAWVASSIEDVLRVGTETVPTSMEWRTVNSASAAERLQLPGDARLYQLRSVREHRGMPIYLLEAYVAAEIGREVKRSDLQHSMLIDILERRLDVEVANGLEEISAVVADRDIARRLKIKVGSPLLFLELTYFNRAGRPVEYAKAWYRADRFTRRNLLARGHLPKWHRSSNDSASPAPRTGMLLQFPVQNVKSGNRG